MLPAIGVNIALKGATDIDLNTVQSILDGYREQSCFDPSNGTGQVVRTDALDMYDRGVIGIDLSMDGVVKFVVDSREGTVFLSVSDRQALLSQLVLMFSGYKFADVDFDDYMPIFEKGCTFRYAECNSEGFDKSLSGLFDDALDGVAPNEVDAFIQVTDGDLEIINNYKIRDNLHSVLFQLVSTESGTDKCGIALFS